MVVSNFAAVSYPPVPVGGVPPDTVVLSGTGYAFPNAPFGAIWRLGHQLIAAIENGAAGWKGSHFNLVRAEGEKLMVIEG